MEIDPEKRYTATMSTSMGDVVIALDAVQAPQTVNNFVFLARDGYFDGTTFHRVIKDFMVQGGDPTGTGAGGPGYRIADEFHPELRFDRPYLLAMANAGPGTNGSQFFITVGPNGVALPPQYSLFGKVVKGMDVVDQIEKVRTGAADKPNTDVTINSVTITESE
ncbi:MAG: peptidylprolyl isomerase [Actinobacteria bacterium]|nr:peptidylprolyl isomerase [Actinomycetota bacterium]